MRPEFQRILSHAIGAGAVLAVVGAYMFADRMGADLGGAVGISMGAIFAGLSSA